MHFLYEETHLSFVVAFGAVADLRGVVVDELVALDAKHVRATNLLLVLF